MSMTGFRPSDQLVLDAFQPEAVSKDTHAANEQLAARLAGLSVPTGLDELRQAHACGLMGLPVSPKSPHARVMTIPGSGGDIPLRILVPDKIKGAYLHLHGGGCMIGTNDMQDERLELLGREAGLVTISVDYRLAPEHPYPAAIEDCVIAALWLIDNAEAQFGTSWLSIGGESAGAHLAASTLIRLRNIGLAGLFGAVNLMYGCFDLSLTPSMRKAYGTPVIDRSAVEMLVDAFCGDVSPCDPDVSPLYADLRGLPPALISVGTLDPLLDDSMFMHMRWLASGNESKLTIHPGGVHGFAALKTDLANEANRAVAQFLRSKQPIELHI